MTTGPLSKKLFPASLLLEGRRCLVVGGGRVAARKAKKLVAAGADLTVVAPTIREQIRILDGVHLLERAFEESDLEGVYLVCAATDDSALNQHVIEGCREKKILCSAADTGWSDGDFILPASFSEDGLTVAISTGGRACRRARLLRESLSRHVEFLQNVDLFVLGIDHRSGDFQGLESLKARRAEFEKILPCIQGVHEFMILDTCNRFEIIGLVSSNTDLELFLKGVPLLGKGQAAFDRLAETAAGLRSQALGETRIVAQIKSALRTAQENRWAGSFLRGWVDITLCISKEIRQLIAPNISAVETEDLVFQWLKKNRPTLGNVLLVGRGEIGRALSARLPDAVQISGRSDEELRSCLPSADLVICATGSEQMVIDDAHRAVLCDEAVLIDVSLPRNINPALPGVVSLCDLRSSVCPENMEQVQAQGREVLARHVGDYERLIHFRKRELFDES